MARCPLKNAPPTRFPRRKSRTLPPILDFTLDGVRFPAHLVAFKRDEVAALAVQPDAAGRLAFRAPGTHATMPAVIDDNLLRQLEGTAADAAAASSTQ
jgi:hypothetical protein